MSNFETELFRLLVVAPPKSASTYVATVIRAYFGIEDVATTLVHVDWGAEQNLTPWVSHDVRGKDFCFNFHMLPHQSNLEAAILEKIGLVGLWRNLGDMIVSMDDHQFRETFNAPMFFTLDHEKYRARPASARYAFLIDTIVPWYLSFYLRWRSLDLPLHPYENMLLDLRSYFTGILTWVTNGATLDEERFTAALSIDPATVNRFNVGLVGRSATKFDDAVKRRLEDQILTHSDREQLEVLLWELPWEVPALQPRSALDGQVVRVDGDELAYFVTGGRAFPIARPAWLHSRTGERRIPRTITAAELRGLPVGEAMI